MPCSWLSTQAQTYVGIGDMTFDAHARLTDILYPNMHTYYAHTYMYTHANTTYMYIHTHTNTGLDDSIHTILLCIYVHVLPHIYIKKPACLLKKHIHT